MRFHTVLDALAAHEEAAHPGGIKVVSIIAFHPLAAVDAGGTAKGALVRISPLGNDQLVAEARISSKLPPAGSLSELVLAAGLLEERFEGLSFILPDETNVVTLRVPVEKPVSLKALQSHRIQPGNKNNLPARFGHELEARASADQFWPARLSETGHF